uniref:Uncharacterized protein n=1 Tax=Candidatus Kentrum sp. DK TaxID=2126562 RepID=A0A450SWE0_9GAMM|nr:MAG: hypothetical protein BECKDK2373B_GA0170837_10731 [Candidatus Kentron sp. DK]
MTRIPASVGILEGFLSGTRYPQIFLKSPDLLFSGKLELPRLRSQAGAWEREKKCSFLSSPRPHAFSVSQKTAKAQKRKSMVYIILRRWRAGRGNQRMAAAHWAIFLPMLAGMCGAAAAQAHRDSVPTQGAWEQAKAWERENLRVPTIIEFQERVLFHKFFM